MTHIVASLTLIFAVVLGSSATAFASHSPTPAPSSSSTTPAPSATPCLAGMAEGWWLSPERIAPGDAVTVEGGRRDFCFSEEPTHDFRLLAKPEGSESLAEVAQTTNGPDGRFFFTVRPTVATTFAVTIDGRPLTGPTISSDTVTVDRRSGTCATAVTLSAPTRVRIGSRVVLSGRTSDAGTVSILFRKLGQPAFQVRRSLVPAADGSFSTSYVADDDYRYFAASSRCDSAVGLTQVTPTISAPSVVARGSAVGLVVRTPAGVGVAVYFRAAGADTFQLRRVGQADATGVYRTHYLANTDYRYYAITGPDRRTTPIGLTQVR